MATELARAYVTLIPSLKGAQKSIESQLGSIDTSSVGRKLGGGMSKSIGAAFSLDSVSDKIISFSDKAGRLGNDLTNKITKPALAAGSALAAITIGSGLSRLTAIDDARAKLTGLGHSAETVDVIMSNALASVKGTAYGLGEAASVAAAAVASGIEPGQQLETVLKTIGDTAAISGLEFANVGAIFNSVLARGKLQGDDMLQLTSQGVPVLQALADQLGVTTEAVSEMVSDGEIDFETFRAAMDGAMGGSALAMGNSFTGALKNTKAAVGRVGAAFLDAGGNGGGFFSQMKPLLMEFTGLLDGAEVSATDLGERFGKAFSAMVEWIRENQDAIREFGGDFAETYKEIGGFLRDLAKSAMDMYRSLSPATQDFLLKTLAVGSAASTVAGPFLKVLSPAIGAFGRVLKTSAPALSTFWGWLRKTDSAASGTAKSTGKVAKSTEGAAKGFSGLTTAGKLFAGAGIAMAVGGVAQAAYDAVAGTAELERKMRDSIEGGYDYADALAEAMDSAEGLGDAQKIANDQLRISYTRSVSAGNGIDGFVESLDRFKDGNTSYLDGLALLTKDIPGVGIAAQTMKNDFSAAMADFDTVAVSGVLAAQAAIVAEGGELDQAAKDTMLNLFATLRDLDPEFAEEGEALIRSLAAGMAVYWPELADYSEMSAGEIVERIKARLNGESTGLQEAGSDMLDEIAAGMQGAIDGSFDETAIQAMQSMLDSFKSENLPRGFEAVGTEKMRELASGFAEAVPELREYSTMTGDEIIAVFEGRFEQMYGIGYSGAIDMGDGILEANPYVAASADLVAASSERMKDKIGDASTWGSTISSLFGGGIASREGDVRTKSLSIAAATGAMRQVGDPNGWGAGISGSFGSGIASMRETVNAKSVGISAAAGAMKNVGDTWSWGNEAGHNFANGISSAYDAVRNAASALTGAVAGLFKHSIAKEGPLHNGGKGEAEWGLHAGQNFADGLRRSAPSVSAAARYAVDGAARAFSGNVGLPLNGGSPLSVSADLVGMSDAKRASDAKLDELIYAVRDLHASLGGIIAANAPSIDKRNLRRVVMAL